MEKGYPDLTIVVCAWGEPYLSLKNRAIDSALREAPGARVLLLSEQPERLTDDLRQQAQVESYQLAAGHHNTGLARNRGLAMVESEWVLFLDADDELAPGAIAALYTAREQRECVAVGGRLLQVLDGHHLQHHWPAWWASRLPRVVYRLASGLRCLIHVGSGALLSTQAAQAAGGFASQASDDWPLAAALSRQGPVNYTTSTVLIYHRREGSMWHRPHTRADLSANAASVRHRLSRVSQAGSGELALLRLWHSLDAIWYARGGSYDPMAYARRRHGLPPRAVSGQSPAR